MVLAQEPHVVAHPDPSGEPNASVGERGLAPTGLRRCDAEQVVDPLPRDPDHRPGASAPAAPAGGGSGTRHTGQTTAEADISVLHVGQWTARPRSDDGIHSGGGTAGEGAIGGGGRGRSARSEPSAIGGGGGGGADGVGGLAAATGPSAWGTVAPQRVQKSVPGSARVPHLGQTITSR